MAGSPTVAGHWVADEASDSELSSPRSGWGEACSGADGGEEVSSTTGAVMGLRAEIAAAAVMAAGADEDSREEAASGRHSFATSVMGMTVAY